MLSWKTSAFMTRFFALISGVLSDLFSSSRFATKVSRSSRVSGRYWSQASFLIAKRSVAYFIINRLATIKRIANPFFIITLELYSSTISRFRRYHRDFNCARSSKLKKKLFIFAGSQEFINVLINISSLLENPTTRKYSSIHCFKRRRGEANDETEQFFKLPILARLPKGARRNWDISYTVVLCLFMLQCISGSKSAMQSRRGVCEITRRRGLGKFNEARAAREWYLTGESDVRRNTHATTRTLNVFRILETGRWPDSSSRTLFHVLQGALIHGTFVTCRRKDSGSSARA